MGVFSHLDLKKYEEEDLEELLEVFPDLLEMTSEQLDRAASDLYWKAQHLYDEVMRLESQADTIRKYMELTEK